MNPRLAGLYGLAFAVLYFAYMTMLDPPDISTPGRDVLVYWADTGNQTQAVALATMCATAVLMFVGSSVGLAKRLEDGAAVACAHAARVAGGMTATLLLVGTSVFAAPALALALNNEAVPMDADLALALLAPLPFFGPLLLLVWTAVISVWMLVFPRTSGQVTRA